jgi:hypothetical protein
MRWQKEPAWAELERAAEAQKKAAELEKFLRKNGSRIT